MSTFSSRPFALRLAWFLAAGAIAFPPAVPFLPGPLVVVAQVNAGSGAFTVTGIGGGGGMFTPIIAEGDPNLMFLTCDMSGVYRSTDAGKSWQLIHYKQLAGALQCRPAWVGAAIYWAGGDNALKLSRDRGETWTAVVAGQQPWKGRISHLAAAPPPGRSLLVGTTEGIWVSADEGKAWRTVGAGRCGGMVVLPGRWFVALATPDGKTHQALLRSTDGGTTWQTVSAAELKGRPITALAGAAAADRVRLYATVEGLGTLLCDDPAGEQWQRVHDWQQQRDVLVPRGQVDVACTSQSGGGSQLVWRTGDGGKTWASIFQLTGPQRNVEPSWVQTYYKWGYYISPLGLGIDPGHPATALVSTQGDLYRTTDAGRSWQPIMNAPLPCKDDPAGLAFRSIGLEVTTCWGYYFDPSDAKRHYLAYTDIGFARSVDQGQTWIPATRGCPWGNTIYEIAFDPFTKGRLFAAASHRHDIPHWTNVEPNAKGQTGGVCVSDDYAANWRVANKGLPDLPCTSIVVDPRSPRDQLTLYAAVFGAGVYRSRDGGKTWESRSRGLGNRGNLHALRVRLHPQSGSLYCLITASRRGGSFPVPGGVWQSTDAGATWRDLTAELKLIWPIDVVLHPKDPNTLYVSAGTGPGKPQGGAYKTTDGGKTWKRLVSDTDLGRWIGPEFDNCVNLAMHPDDPNLLYLGSEGHGLWASQDGGAKWKVFAKFPFRGPTNVAFDPADRKRIYVTTFGGGVWKGPHLPVNDAGAPGITLP